jgi:hypothetical protein
MAWQLKQTMHVTRTAITTANARYSSTPTLLQRQQQQVQQQRVQQQRLGVAVASSNGGEAPMSYDDDADSGLSKLRYNKRQNELPKELQGEAHSAM